METLDHLSHSVDSMAKLVKTKQFPRLRKASRKFSLLQHRLSKEIDYLSQMVHDSSLSHSLKEHLEKWSNQAQLFSEAMALKYREVNRDDWISLLKSFSERIGGLQNDLKGINFRDAWGHLAEAVTVDHFDGMGIHHIIQWPRKIWHMAASLLIIFIYLVVPGEFSHKIIAFGIFTGLTLLGEIIRLNYPRFNAIVIRDAKKYMRKREADGLSSMTFFAVSTLLVCLIFPKGVAILSILYLGFGDALASIVGVKWGRHKVGRRFSVEGSLTFFATCFLITLIYPFLNPAFSGSILGLAFLGGLIGMVSEWLSFRLDDNLVIPLVSAVFLQSTLFFLG